MEAIYHYLWKHQLCGRELTTTDGNVITVKDPGRYNIDAGPDFFNAKIHDGEREWCGNIEIHVKASDWYRHGHQNDPAYDNIILHVVAVNDMTIKRKDESEIPQVCLTATEQFIHMYVGLTETLGKPSCLAELSRLGRLQLTDWVETLGIERIQQKARRFEDLVRSLKGDMYQGLYILLARGLGFGLNSVPFEELAKSVSLNYLMRHRDNIHQLEALLFGQAGMLDSQQYGGDEYYFSLCREYQFLSKKYGLNPIRPGLWKYSRTRPQNFPHRRIAILASALSDGLKLQEKLLAANGDTDRLREVFSFPASDYWKTHHNFNQAGEGAVTLSRGSLDLLLINVAAPFYYGYGAMTGDYDTAEKGVDLLNELNPEKNSIVMQWLNAGLKASNAFQSQALIQLRKEYCDRDRCLECRIGLQILKKCQ